MKLIENCLGLAFAIIFAPFFIFVIGIVKAGEWWGRYIFDSK